MQGLGALTPLHSQNSAYDFWLPQNLTGSLDLQA